MINRLISMLQDVERNNLSIVKEVDFIPPLFEREICYDKIFSDVLCG